MTKGHGGSKNEGTGNALSAIPFRQERHRYPHYYGCHTFVPRYWVRPCPWGGWAAARFYPATGIVRRR